MPEVTAYAIPGAVKTDVLLSGYTTFRLGGPCPILVDVRTAEECAAVIRHLRSARQSFRVIGEGSNLVISDHGLDTAVVRFVSDQSGYRRRGEIVTVPAGMRLDALAARSVEQGSDALVFASGIPGTVGGAVCGNAGAFGCRISDVLVEVRLLDEQDTDCWCSAEQLGFGYRRSRLQRGTAVVLEARFRCAVAAGPDAASRRRGEILRLRRDKHPDWRTLPCAGSVFRNLEQAEGARRIAAGKLLEQAGAAGMHHGGVRVYEKHANIIVRDRADASAQDVHDLALRMYQAVRRMHRVSLVPEIHFLGAFEHTPDTVKWIKKE